MSHSQSDAAHLTIFSGTNRPDSYSLKVAIEYRKKAEAQGQSCKVLSMTDLPAGFIHEHWNGGSPDLERLAQDYVQSASRFVFIVPEYNGSFPGIMKAFIDCVPPSFFHEKRAGVVGISAGRAGNLRGADQLTNVLNYLRVNVYYNKPKLSAIEQYFEHGKPSAELLDLLENHVKGVVSF